MVGGADLIVSLEDERFRLPASGATFDGRDVFGPAAAVLADGQAEITDLGPVLDPDSITPLLIPLAEPAGNGAIKASVLWVDTYGNAQLNVSPEDLNKLGLVVGDDVLIGASLRESRISWQVSFGSVEEGEPVVHVDSHGQIAIAVRGGRADDDLEIGVGDPVIIGRPDGGNRIDLKIVGS
jgi:S-adenosylmethionine hydrolase